MVDFVRYTFKERIERLLGGDIKENYLTLILGCLGLVTIILLLTVLVIMVSSGKGRAEYQGVDSYDIKLTAISRAVSDAWGEQARILKRASRGTSRIDDVSNFVANDIILEGCYEALRKLNPPREFASCHRKYLKSLRFLKEASSLLNRACTTGDALSESNFSNLIDFPAGVIAIQLSAV